MIIRLFFFVAVCSCVKSIAQDFSKPMQHAYLLTRMAEKFHIQPKPLNDELSNLLFEQVLKTTDKDHVIFLQEDINALSVFRYRLDEEITERKTNFLQQLNSIWQKRVKQNDSLALVICKTAFNFSLTETYREADDSLYAINVEQKKQKLSRMLKWRILDRITDHLLETAETNKEINKKRADSMELVLRKSLATSYSKETVAVKRAQQYEQRLGNLFCNVLALCYDPHSSYMPAEEKEAFDEGMGQKPMRFGLGLNENESGEVTIDHLQPGSSAYKSGVMNTGDKIITMQEPGKQPVNVSGFNLFQTDSLINESTADKLIVTIKKPDGTTKQVTLYKERFATEEDEEDLVLSYILKGEKNIGYISIPDFYVDWENTETGINGCANDVAKEILKLKKEQIDGLIIDIRYNGGGSVQEAIELSGIFIDGGPVAQLKAKEPKPYTLKDVNSGSIFDGPLLIMVNGYSASASELFSGALQDYNRAVVAGTPTYGKATGQIIFPLDTTVTLETLEQKKADVYVKLTTSVLYRLTGQTAQQHGVVPDVLLPDLLQTVGEKEKDEQFSFTLSPIEKNKYYKPAAPIANEVLRRMAGNVTDTAVYFKKLKEYNQWIKTVLEQKEFSLKLDDVLKVKKEQQAYLDFFENWQQTNPFTVTNHSLQKERLRASEWLAEMDNETKEAVAQDPYIHLCYLLLLKMIKP